MTLQSKLIALFVTLLLGCGMGFGARSYMASKERLAIENANLKQDKAEFKSYIDKAETQVAKYNALQDKLYTLDTAASKDLNDQLDENDRLRGDLAVAQRMRLQGARCVASPASGQDASAGGVGSDLQVELTGETRQAVWDLRASLVKDLAVIAYYQGYTEAIGKEPVK